MKLRPRPRRAVSIGAVAALVCTVATTALPRPALADSVTADRGWRIAQQYTGVWSSPPTVLTGGETVDAPLLGNGDIGVAIGGSISNQTMYLGKNDFFSGSRHAIEPLGRIVVTAAGLAGASRRSRWPAAARRPSASRCRTAPAARRASPPPAATSTPTWPPTPGPAA